MSILAILVAKFIYFIVRLFGLGGGSAAPGLVALKIDPKLITHLASKIPQNIIITGTNGKTTTARLLAHFAKTQDLKIIHNHTGSNLERGIASTLLKGVRMFHPQGGIALHLSFDLGIWELDEAAFNTVAPKLNPSTVIFLNAFRDQLDRYGEIDSVVKNWQKTLKKLPRKTTILINGDDTNTKKLVGKNPILRFGIDKNKISGESVQRSKKDAKLDFEAINVKLNGLIESSFQLQTSKIRLPVSLPLPGIYNIYNFLAAFSIGLKLGFEPRRMLGSLKSFTPAFGRAEKFSKGSIYLIKNPVGTTQVLQTLTPNLKPSDVLLIALNDKIADGTDVSWIWDADFERLLVASDKLLVTCSGSRAYDLALRLKYAGMDTKQLIVEPELKKAFTQAQVGLKGRLFVLPTYTAMLELQNILSKSGAKRNYWEEA